jgi:hypothetical protein
MPFASTAKLAQYCQRLVDEHANLHLQRQYLKAEIEDVKAEKAALGSYADSNMRLAAQLNQELHMRAEVGRRLEAILEQMMRDPRLREHERYMLQRDIANARLVSVENIVQSIQAEAKLKQQMEKEEAQLRPLHHSAQVPSATTTTTTATTTSAGAGASGTATNVSYSLSEGGVSAMNGQGSVKDAESASSSVPESSAAAEMPLESGNVSSSAPATNSPAHVHSLPSAAPKQEETTEAQTSGAEGTTLPPIATDATATPPADAKAGGDEAQTAEVVTHATADEDVSMQPTKEASERGEEEEEQEETKAQGETSDAVEPDAAATRTGAATAAEDAEMNASAASALPSSSTHDPEQDVTMEDAPES